MWPNKFDYKETVILTYIITDYGLLMDVFQYIFICVYVARRNRTLSTISAFSCEFCNFLNSNVRHTRRERHFVCFLMTNDYANFVLDHRKRTQRRIPTSFNQFIIKAHGQKRTTCNIETVGGKDLLGVSLVISLVVKRWQLAKLS